MQIQNIRHTIQRVFTQTVPCSQFQLHGINVQFNWLSSS